jgi:hypothetical protein
MGIDRGMIVDSLKARGVLVPATPPPPDRPTKSDVLVLPRSDAEIVIRALAEASVRDRSRYFDSQGHSLWGFGEANAPRGHLEIAAAPDIELQVIATRALRVARPQRKSRQRKGPSPA